MTSPAVIIPLMLVTALATVFVLMLRSVWARRRRQQAMERMQKVAEAEAARFREEILSRTPYVKMRDLDAGRITAGTIKASDIQSHPYRPGVIINAGNPNGKITRIEGIRDE